MANNINNTNNLSLKTGYDPVITPNRPEGGYQVGESQHTMSPELNAYIDDKSAIFNKNSNFETFIRMIKNLPESLDILTELLGFQSGEVITEFANKEFADELMKLFAQTDVPKEELANLLKEQVQSSTKFQAPLFDVLRNVLDKTDNQEVITKVLNFSKKFSDFVSNKHVLKSIVIDLKNMTDYMNKDGKAIVNHLADQINLNAESGDVKENLDVIRKQIIPFLGNYIKSTNDFGTLRDIITSVLLNTARYENGSKEGVIQTFQNLEGYNIVKKGLDESFSIYGILNEVELGIRENEVERDSPEESIVKILKLGLEGKAGFENIDSFKQVLNNLLMNESVYLPIIHVLFPVNIDQHMFFSDVWIDPNNEEESGGKGSDDDRKVKLFLKFDIKEIGSFDVVLYLKNETMDIQVFTPERIAKLKKEVKKNVANIIEKNGFKIGDVFIDESKKPLTVLDVFPKIYEGKNSINVRI